MCESKLEAVKGRTAREKVALSELKKMLAYKCNAFEQVILKAYEMHVMVNKGRYLPPNRPSILEHLTELTEEEVEKDRMAALNTDDDCPSEEGASPNPKSSHFRNPADVSSAHDWYGLGVSVLIGQACVEPEDYEAAR